MDDLIVGASQLRRRFSSWRCLCGLRAQRRAQRHRLDQPHRSRRLHHHRRFAGCRCGL
ncbi:hypothetical protein [Hankyongella ginsenosidimutans]|uniref:hypothetical protein n=1 Tax=Hankyongella ginsenosidimutans TaxID=1763828 RepID=UPI003CCC79FF